MTEPRSKEDISVKPPKKPDSDLNPDFVPDMVTDVKIDQENGNINFFINVKQGRFWSSGIPWEIESQDRQIISNFFMRNLVFDVDRQSMGYGWQKYRQFLHDRSYELSVIPIVSGQTRYCISFKVDISAGQGVHMYEPAIVLKSAINLIQPLFDYITESPSSLSRLNQDHDLELQNSAE